MNKKIFSVFLVCAFLFLVLVGKEVLKKSSAMANCAVKKTTSDIYILAEDCTLKSGKTLSLTGGQQFNLNGKTLRCSPDDSGSSGIKNIARDGKRITISNGSITSCKFGITAHKGPITIDNVDFTGNKSMALNLGGTNNTIIRHSKFDQIGGFQGEAYAIGINHPGDNCLIEHNTFRNFIRQPADSETVGEGVAILIGANEKGCKVQNNIISNDTYNPTSIGIWGGDHSSADVRMNIITNYDRGIVAYDTAQVFAENNTVRIDGPHIRKNSVGIFVPGGGAKNNRIGRAYDQLLYTPNTAADLKLNKIIP